MAALQVCLGASARATHRATRLDKLICDGWQGDAELSVQLLNDKHGYRFDTYGASITVKRVIRRDAQSLLYLLDDHGKTVSWKRKEVRAWLLVVISTDRWRCVCGMHTRRQGKSHFLLVMAAMPCAPCLTAPFEAHMA